MLIVNPPTLKLRRAEVEVSGQLSNHLEEDLARLNSIKQLSLFLEKK